MQKADSSSGAFKVDRTIPLVLVVTIALQTLGLAWFGGALHQRVTTNESIISQLSSDNRNSLSYAARLSAIESSLEQIRNDVRSLRDRRP